MATLNVQTDYGAAGDGTTDDTDAIQAAIDDATSGDVVYLPADTYLISRRRGRNPIHACLDFQEPNGMDGVTFQGDGKATEIVVDGGHDVDFSGPAGLMALAVRGEGNVINGLVLEDFSIRGQRGKQSGDVGDGHGISLREGSTSSGSITLQNIRIENCVGAGISCRIGDTTIQNCTVSNSYDHGISGDARSAEGPIDIKQCLVREHDNASRGNYGFDRSKGTGVVEDSVVYDARGNGQGMKTTAETDDVTFRRVRFNSMRHNGVQYAGSTSAKRSKVTLENVVAENCDNIGIRMGRETDYTIPSGSAVISTNNSGQYGFRMADDANLQSDGQVYVNYNDNDEAFRAESPATGYLSSFQHTENAGETLTSRSVDLQSIGSELQSDIDAVPTRDEVGAWAGTGDTSDGTEEETKQYQTDFGTETLGTTPANWTPRLDSTDDNWNVIERSGTYGSQALEFDASSATGHALQWDQLSDTVSDVEVLQLVRIPQLDGTEYAGRIRARFGASGYTAEFGGGEFRMYETGSATTLGTTGNPNPDTWYWMRFRLNGDSLKLRTWELSTAEPGTWDIDVTDTTHQSGWVGLGSYQARLTEWGWVSAATNGDTAPMPSEGLNQAVMNTVAGSLQSKNGVIDTS